MAFPKTTFVNAESSIMGGLMSAGISKRKAEDELFKLYSYFIREGIRKYSISEDDSIDVYSDTILSTIQKITDRSFEGRSSLKTYIYQIFHNKCVDLLRKKTTNKNIVNQTVSINDMLYQISDVAKPIIQKLTEQSDWELLKARLNEMGENCRRLLMFFAEGYTDKDIAVVFEYKTADVVKTSRLRCIERLRLLYKRGN